MLMISMMQFDNDGDKLRFTAIYHTYSSRMYAAAFRLLRSREQAEDVMHDAWLKIIRSFDTCLTLPEPELGRWIATITKNTALDALRRNKCNLPLETAPEQYAPETVENQEEYHRLLELIQELPEQYREIVTLKYVHEWKSAEIARYLGLTEGAVNVRLHRCRNDLLNKLREEGFDYDE